MRVSSIRQDSAELTVVSLMARRNVADGTGANRVWALEQVTTRVLSKQASFSKQSTPSHLGYLLTDLLAHAHTDVRQAHRR